MATHVLCKASEISPGSCKSFKIDGRGIALYNVDGVFYATQDFCRHKGGSLGKGTLEGPVIECPLHGWKYNVMSGECLTLPQCKKLQRFPARVEGDEIVVDVE